MRFPIIAALLGSLALLSLASPNNSSSLISETFNMSPIPFRTDRVRLLVFLKKREDLTKEEFGRYWSGPHAKLFLSLDIVKKNLLKYEQAYTNDQHLTFAATLGLTAPDWDGIVVVEGQTYEKIFEVFTSDEYNEVVAPDDLNFIDFPKSQVLPVDLLTFFDKV